MNSLHAQWVQTNGPYGGYIDALAVNGSYLFAGTGDGVFRSADNGANWTAANQGLANSDVQSLAFNGGYLFAGIKYGSVWRRFLSDLVAVENLSTAVPAGFSLSQNYPNPFHSETTITFDLPSKEFVSLRVFDALGNEVSVLVHEQLPAGTYSERWNAEGLPDGVYFYRLEAGAFSETKKLILLR